MILASSALPSGVFNGLRVLSTILPSNVTAFSAYSILAFLIRLLAAA